jgi:hypothetical protein
VASSSSFSSSEGGSAELHISQVKGILNLCVEDFVEDFLEGFGDDVDDAVGRTGVIGGLGTFNVGRDTVKFPTAAGTGVDEVD